MKLMKLLLSLTLISFAVGCQKKTEKAAPLPVPVLAPIDASDFADPLLTADLLQFQKFETKGLTKDEVRALNEATIQKLCETEIPERPSIGGEKPRLTAIDEEVGQFVIDSIGRHPVVSSVDYDARYRYNRPAAEKINIGFCFGRAAYAHLALLRMGVSKEAIRKIWIVGPMHSSDINWAFHVSTIVKTTSGKWMAVDDFYGELREIRDWLKDFYPSNKRGDLRVYITTPAKFSVSLGEYDRIQTGLDLPKYQDWYQHYFYDLMDWFQHADVDGFGLVDLRKEQAKKETESDGAKEDKE